MGRIGSGRVNARSRASSYIAAKDGSSRISINARKGSKRTAGGDGERMWEQRTVSRRSNERRQMPSGTSLAMMLVDSRRLLPGAGAVKSSLYVYTRCRCSPSATQFQIPYIFTCIVGCIYWMRLYGRFGDQNGTWSARVTYSDIMTL